MGSAGTEPEGVLHPVHSELINGPFPHSVLGWLRRSNGGAAILGGLGSAEIPVTHEGLDQVGGKVADFVRSMLTATGILPERNSDIVRFEHWLDAYIDERSEKHSTMLRQFGKWVVLRRLRRTSGVVLSDGQISNAREEIRQPARLLEWLEEHQRDLSDLDQAAIDRWLTEGATSRRRVRPFLRWAQQHHLARSDLRMPPLSAGHATAPVTTDDRWKQVTRLLHDETIELQTRVAGLLVLLYGQQASRLTLLTVERISADRHGTLIHLGRTPVRLPPGVDELVKELRDRRQGTSVQPARRQWLFTGKLPGLPIKAGRLHVSLNKLGIACAQHRQTALLELASQLPAPVLADLLDVHPTSAARWKKLGQGDWASYVAHRATGATSTTAAHTRS
jgi:hypothetical protein